jgi:HEAT repeat protein
MDRNTDITLKLYCELVWRSLVNSPAQAFESLMKLAEHHDWQIREYVASSAGELFDRYFQELREHVLRFAQVGSPNVKRAIALSIKIAARSRDNERVNFLLDVTDKLLSEEDPYVLKNLGPFAIGDGLLRYYTDPTLAALKRWSKSENPVVRWNVAMALTTASARERASLVKPILRNLSTDTDKSVQRAVAKAKRNLT